MASNIIEAIDAAWTHDNRKERAYLGASMIGSSCFAFLQMGLRGYPQKPPEPRFRRIFRDGHRIEDVVVSDMKKAGINVMEKSGVTGKQFSWRDWGGHVVAHGDGIVEIELGKPVMLLEIKSMNDKSFEETVKKGVRHAKPTYFEQMQMMMGMSGIRSAMFVAYNKNTSIYHVEIVDYDDLAYGFIRDKIDQTLKGEAQRAADEPERFVCRFCSRKEVCWTSDQDHLIERACRTCTHASPTPQGDWHCGLHNKRCSDPCDRWTKLEIKPAP